LSKIDQSRIIGIIKERLWWL